MALKERSVIPPEIAEIICTTEVSVDSHSAEFEHREYTNKIHILKAPTSHLI